MSAVVGLAALVVMAASMPGPASAAASDFLVTTPEDGPDASPGDGLCETEGGACTLRAAVMEANAEPGTDIIQLPPGTYALTLSGADEDGATTGDLDVLADVSIEGASTPGTVVQGAWSGETDRIFDVRSGSLLLSDLTVTGGQIESTQSDIRQGGGIRVAAGAALALERGLVTLNHVTGEFGSGGGLFVEGSASIIASTLSENDAVGRGGGLRVTGEGTLRNVTIHGNSATDDGGGIAVTGMATMNNVTIDSNVADRHASVNGDGGGIQVDPEGTARLANSLVGDNRDPSTAGVQHPDCSGAIASDGHNLVESTTGCSGLVASDLTEVDPKRLGFDDHGGGTPTTALQADSPAVDSGGGGTSCEPTDQRGVPRSGGCDVGAFERVVCDDILVTVVGSPGSDVLSGSPGTDGIHGFAGNDQVRASGGDDALCGGEGNDKLRGGGGKDQIFGDSGNDRLKGQGGADRLKGGPGRDRMTGGGGRDRCGGGPGRDRSAGSCEKGRA